MSKSWDERSVRYASLSALNVAQAPQLVRAMAWLNICSVVDQDWYALRR
jgi:hypothetical protein